MYCTAQKLYELPTAYVRTSSLTTYVDLYVSMYCVVDAFYHKVAESHVILGNGRPALTLL